MELTPWLGMTFTAVIRLWVSADPHRFRVWNQFWIRGFHRLEQWGSWSLIEDLHSTGINSLNMLVQKDSFKNLWNPKNREKMVKQKSSCRTWRRWSGLQTREEEIPHFNRSNVKCLPCNATLCYWEKPVWAHVWKKNATWCIAGDVKSTERECDPEDRKNDALYKLKSRRYHDRRRNVKKSGIAVGDRIPMKNKQTEP